jgi:putative CocE/NonD family hydrolase
MEVSGKVGARLYASFHQPTADYTAKLVDVYPDGFELILADGIARVSRAAQAPQLVRIDLGSVSNLFMPGHRIGVEIAASNYPRAEPNPNKGTVSLHTGPVFASAIDLPVVR